MPDPIDPTRTVVALIEDEPLVRVPFAKALSEAGYSVLAAASGADGLSLIDDPTIDIAVIDVRLPGRVDGVALARETRRQRPDLPVIFVSALAPEEDAMALGVFLQKPFDTSELLGTIAACLRARGRPID